MAKRKYTIRLENAMINAIADISKMKGVTGTKYVTHHLIKAIKKDPNYKELGYSIDIDL
jgi:hypothetical protein